MICPNCKSGLTKKTFRSCEVYCCMECDGVWAGKETFIRLGNIMSFDLPEERRKFGLFKPRDIKKSAKPGLVRICPQCEIGMHQFNYAYDSNIFLDRCPVCGGIWADAGEMMQVAKFLKPDIDQRIIGGFVSENPYLKQAEEDADKVQQIIATVLYVLRLIVFKI